MWHTFVLQPKEVIYITFSPYRVCTAFMFIITRPMPLSYQGPKEPDKAISGFWKQMWEVWVMFVCLFSFCELLWKLQCFCFLCSRQVFSSPSPLSCNFSKVQWEDKCSCSASVAVIHSALTDYLFLAILILLSLLQQIDRHNLLCPVNMHMIYACLGSISVLSTNPSLQSLLLC